MLHIQLSNDCNSGHLWYVHLLKGSRYGENIYYGNIGKHALMILLQPRSRDTNSSTTVVVNELMIVQKMPGEIIR